VIRKMSTTKLVGIHVKEDAVIACAAAPTGGLVFQTRNVTLKWIRLHNLQSGGDAPLVLIGNSLEFFFGAFRDSKCPGHGGLD